MHVFKFCIEISTNDQSLVHKYIPFIFHEVVSLSSTLSIYYA